MRLFQCLLVVLLVLNLGSVAFASRFKDVSYQDAFEEFEQDKSNILSPQDFIDYFNPDRVKQFDRFGFKPEEAYKYGPGEQYVTREEIGLKIFNSLYEHLDLFFKLNPNFQNIQDLLKIYQDLRWGVEHVNRYQFWGDLGDNGAFKRSNDIKLEFNVKGYRLILELITKISERSKDNLDEEIKFIYSSSTNDLVDFIKLLLFVKNNNNLKQEKSGESKEYEDIFESLLTKVSDRLLNDNEVNSLLNFLIVPFYNWNNARTFRGFYENIQTVTEEEWDSEKISKLNNPEMNKKLYTFFVKVLQKKIQAGQKVLLSQVEIEVLNNQFKKFSSLQVEATEGNAVEVGDQLKYVVRVVDVQKALTFWERVKSRILHLSKGIVGIFKKKELKNQNIQKSEQEKLSESLLSADSIETFEELVSNHLDRFTKNQIYRNPLVLNKYLSFAPSLKKLDEIISHDPLHPTYILKIFFRKVYRYEKILDFNADDEEVLKKIAQNIDGVFVETKTAFEANPIFIPMWMMTEVNAIDEATQAQKKALLLYFKALFEKNGDSRLMEISSYEIKFLNEHLKKEFGLELTPIKMELDGGIDKIRLALTKPQTTSQKLVKNLKKAVGKVYKPWRQQPVSLVDSRYSEFQEFYSQREFQSAEEVIQYFQPRRLPDFPDNILYSNELELGAVIFDAMESVLPAFLKLNPSTKQKVEFMAIAREFYNGKIQSLHNSRIYRNAYRFISLCYDQFLSTASTIEEWKEIANFKVANASEWEWLQAGRMAVHSFRIVEISPPDLNWMKDLKLTLVINQDHPFLLLEDILENVPEEERNDRNNTRIIIQMLRGNYLNERYTYKEETDLRHTFLNAIRSMMSATDTDQEQAEQPQGESMQLFQVNPVTGMVTGHGSKKLADADPRIVGRHVEEARIFLLRYLLARQNAGANLQMSDQEIDAISKFSKKLGYEIQKVSNEPGSYQFQNIKLVQVSPHPDSLITRLKKKCEGFLFDFKEVVIKGKTPIKINVVN